MKIGTFVGQESIVLNGNEVNYVANIIHKVFPFAKVTMESTDYGVMFYIKGIWNHKEYRDIKGNTYAPKYIRVYLCKNRGYDEAKYGRFYEWEDGFVAPYDIESYNCSIDLMGHYRRYRGKTTETWVGITQTIYTYGTELSDLECENGLNKVLTYCSKSYPNNGSRLVA